MAKSNDVDQSCWKVADFSLKMETRISALNHGDISFKWREKTQARNQATPWPRGDRDSEGKVVKLERTEVYFFFPFLEV